MNNKDHYREIAWQKALNKQGYISCCQLFGSMENYVKSNQLSEEEEKWFAKFSLCFLYALQNTPMDSSEKVVFCEECLNFYNRLKKAVE